MVQEESFSVYWQQKHRCISRDFQGGNFLTLMCLLFRYVFFFKFLSFESVTITETLSLFQGQDLFNLGRYIAMSICQGGCGFPFLAQPVYTYLCTGKITEVVLASSDAPDPVLQFVLQKVSN